MGKKRKATTNHYVARAAAAKTELPELPPINVSAFNLTSDIAVVSNNHPSKAPSPAPFRVPDEADEASDEWQLPGRNKKPKKEKQTKDRNYPEICLSPQRLRQPVLLIDIQRLVLWLSADASSPQWVLVRVTALFLSCISCKFTFIFC
jgi:RNA exonuclease 1